MPYLQAGGVRFGCRGALGGIQRFQVGGSPIRVISGRAVSSYVQPIAGVRHCLAVRGYDPGISGSHVAIVKGVSMRFGFRATVLSTIILVSAPISAQTTTYCGEAGFGVRCTTTPTPKSGWDQLNDTLADLKKKREAREQVEQQRQLEQQQAQLRAQQAAQYRELQERTDQLSLQAQQILLQQENQKRDAEDLNRLVSQAVLDHRCEDAKTIALTAGNLGLADQAMRLCTPLKVAPPEARPGGANKPTSSARPGALKQPTSSAKFTYPYANLLNQRSSVQATTQPRPTFPIPTISFQRPEGTSSAVNIYAYRQGEYASQPDKVKFLAESGYVEAQVGLGNMYFSGNGVQQDDAAALNWFRKAADQGDAAAQYNLGRMYSGGRGVPQDDVAAVAWYRKAADQGNLSAQSNLGRMYGTGSGVPKDYVAAVGWYRKAAGKGNAIAQYNLAFMYMNGAGVEKDYIQAFKWFNLAASISKEGRIKELATKNMDTLSSVLSESQIAEAQRLFREWRTD